LRLTYISMYHSGISIVQIGQSLSDVQHHLELKEGFYVSLSRHTLRWGWTYHLVDGWEIHVSL
jgi:hypothetical protein